MDELAGIATGLPPTDEGALVVFGSLARKEFTEGSDLDWAILIDGRADSGHLELVHKLQSELEVAGFSPPGPTEVFGSLVFSHDLIHAIGGDDDTNRNMTRRLLLLLESAPVHVGDSLSVRDRVVQAILDRYVKEDASFLLPEDLTKKISRFLLNDVVRLWRTFAVDYANKYRVRAASKWALRNIKLRMSRKLLFISGLFMCISWKMKTHEVGDRELIHQMLIDHLRDWTQRSPLDSLAEIVRQYAPSLAVDIFDPYDSFLGLLNDRSRRNTLELLTPDDASRNEAFLEARENSGKFNDALIQLLFESHDEVTKLATRYGVF